MRTIDSRHSVHRMLILIAGALFIGLLAQIAATAATGGACDFIAQTCAYGLPWR